MTSLPQRSKVSSRAHALSVMDRGCPSRPVILIPSLPLNPLAGPTIPAESTAPEFVPLCLLAVASSQVRFRCQTPTNPAAVSKTAALLDAEVCAAFAEAPQYMVK